ncbi:hypothetical protein R4Y45_04330 [Holzapfeliella sp. He02]|uniref:Uncharacterized protein n=1 Tax=Holzapfeliella saturejae TaxID=3082953 RepID=A0ABU8SGJ9_9LACO
MNFKKVAVLTTGVLALGGIGLSMIQHSSVQADTTETNHLIEHNIGNTNYIATKPLIVTQINDEFNQLSQAITHLDQEKLSDSIYQERVKELLTDYNGAMISLNVPQTTLENAGIGFSNTRSDITIHVINGTIMIQGHNIETLNILRTAFHDLGTYNHFFGNLTGAESYGSLSLTSRSLTPYLAPVLKAVNVSADELMAVGDSYQNMIGTGQTKGSVTLK